MSQNFRMKWIDAIANRTANRAANRRSEARLCGFSDKMLNDIGLSRSEIEYLSKHKIHQPW